MNAASSRSHCIFTLVVQQMDPARPEKVQAEGKLTLVDLAGSERQQVCNGCAVCRQHPPRPAKQLRMIPILPVRPLPLLPLPLLTTLGLLQGAKNCGLVTGYLVGPAVFKAGDHAFRLADLGSNLLHFNSPPSSDLMSPAKFAHLCIALACLAVPVGLAAVWLLPGTRSCCALQFF